MTFIVSISAPNLSAPVISIGTVTATTAVINLVTPSSSNIPLTGYLISVFNGTSLVATIGVAQSQFPFTLTGLAPSTAYTISANAYEAAGSVYSSPNSPAVVATTISGATRPPQTTGLTATPLSSSSISLSWTATPTASSYFIERNATLIVSGYVGTSYTDIGLLPSTTYTYNIAGANSAGSGNFSLPASATTQASTGTGNLFAYGNSLRGSGKILSGQHVSFFQQPNSDTYGNVWDVWTGSGQKTAANVTIGSTGLCPAIMGCPPMQQDTNITAQQWIAAINSMHAAGVLAQVALIPMNPNGYHSTAINIAQILTAGSALNNTYLHGPGPSIGAGITYNGLDTYVQIFKAINNNNGGWVLRPFPEGNLGSPVASGGFWYETGGNNITSAQYVQLWKMTIDYLKAQGVNFTNVPIDYCTNWFSGNFSQNDPGPGYRDWASLDYYNGNSNTTVLSGLSPANAGMSYLQGLGIPIYFSECGGVTPNNSQISTNEYSNQIFGPYIQQTYSNFIATVFWNQNYFMANQQNALQQLQSCITRGQIPAGVL